MNSRWQANKIGLINFWYYDEQEFLFAKGRMLLRGSNGSGKSVTMQSIVPLLLDGNMSPERLDPFGSRDRKMSSYLLEDEDGREERTGYLYLEFRRKESDTFLTIGMGIRARRGKPMDKWYFSLTDGRRVGKDFWLYKDTGEKITLSRKELEHRVASGGRIFDRQAEYMEYVNNQIFGFDTVEEYKEMVDLLIQLRTPKLSKDFKPSVINEILSDSLQTLSDEDLRPMSEAIENMDTMSLNLKSREDALTAAEKINRVYDKYNRMMLYEKAQALARMEAQIAAGEKEAKEKEQSEKQIKRRIEELQEQKIKLEAAHDAYEKEQASLNASNALELKQRERELDQQITSKKQDVQDKTSSLEEKESRLANVEGQKKKQEDERQTREQKLRHILEKMQESADAMAFEEHSFFSEEFMQQMEEPFSFTTHEQQFDSLKVQIDKTFAILEETNRLEIQADDRIKQREQCMTQLNQAQKKRTEAEKQLLEAENDWKERLFTWNGHNQELLVERDVLTKLSRFADDYAEQSDFASMRSKVGDIYLDKKMSLNSELRETCEAIQQDQEEYAQTQAELAEWEMRKEPEPERSEAVKKNRERLQECGIPYQEFYKLIEFGKTLDETDCGRMEEALMQMGILDALVLDEQYKPQALAFAQGCADRYLFVGKERAEHSLLDVLELNDAVNDIFTNQRLTGILANIAYDEDTAQNDISICSDGGYRMGVLYGTVTGEHEAAFLGTKAREKNRLARIAACKVRLEELTQALQKWEAVSENLKDRMAQLKSEYEALPNDEDMNRAVRVLKAVDMECENMEREKRRLEEQIRILKEEIRKKMENANEIAKKLYLDCNFTTFQTANRAAATYQSGLIQLKAGHETYLKTVMTIQNLQEQIESILVDAEQFRCDIEKLTRELQKAQEEQKSVLEQLKLTNYEEVKERLDACVTWLREYPGQHDACIQEQASKTEQLAVLERQMEEGEKQLAQYRRQNGRLSECFQAELGLHYVALPEDLEVSAESIRRYLEQSGKPEEKNDMIQDLNRVYFDNRMFLNEYQLMQTSIFQEMDDGAADTQLAKRLDITARYQGVKIPFVKLIGHLQEDIEELKNLIRDNDRELFEDILANTVSRKIRNKINASLAWVAKMNRLMESMNTSSGLHLSLRWRSKTAEAEEQLDTKELVELLKKDYRLMGETEAARLSAHFRSKVEEARRHVKNTDASVSFYQVMKDTLDYRKWFEFQLYSQKTGERQKELTNSVFGTFSGGEKAMAMYVPLFSAVVAKYQGGRDDAPRLVSLDEAFAGVDNRNIRDMFRLMTEFEFDFIINSQVLWGDCDTLDALAIYQLQRPQNAKFVTVMPYLWNGHRKELMEDETMLEQRSKEIG